MVPAPIRTITTIDEMRALVARARAEGKRIALVPTMGALHAGHVELVRTALAHAEVVIASVFVNPMQFGPHEDLDRYPRTPEADTETLAELGAEAVFMPTVEEMFPDGGRSATLVTAGHLGTVLEGRSRPGHYDGVLTVVAKLFSIVQPDVALFGEKDAQQLFLVRPNCRGLTNSDAMTMSACSRATRTSSRWPACSAPIVGTSATRLPSARARATKVRASSMVVRVWIGMRSPRCWDSLKPRGA